MMSPGEIAQARSLVTTAINAGASRYNARLIVGSAYQESGFNPQLTGDDRGTSYGLMQVGRNLWNQMQNAGVANDANAQLEFYISYLQSHFPDAWDQMQNASTSRDFYGALHSIDWTLGGQTRRMGPVYADEIQAALGDQPAQGPQTATPEQAQPAGELAPFENSPIDFSQAITSNPNSAQDNSWLNEILGNLGTGNVQTPGNESPSDRPGFADLSALVPPGSSSALPPAQEWQPGQLGPFENISTPVSPVAAAQLLNAGPVPSDNSWLNEILGNSPSGPSLGDNQSDRPGFVDPSSVVPQGSFPDHLSLIAPPNELGPTPTDAWSQEWQGADPIVQSVGGNDISQFANIGPLGQDLPPSPPEMSSPGEVVDDTWSAWTPPPNESSPGDTTDNPFADESWAQPAEQSSSGEVTDNPFGDESWSAAPASAGPADHFSTPSYAGYDPSLGSVGQPGGVPTVAGSYVNSNHEIMSFDPTTGTYTGTGYWAGGPLGLTMGESLGMMTGGNMPVGAGSTLPMPGRGPSLADNIRGELGGAADLMAMKGARHGLDPDTMSYLAPGEANPHLLSNASANWLSGHAGVISPAALGLNGGAVPSNVIAFPSTISPTNAAVMLGTGTFG